MSKYAPLAGYLRESGQQRVPMTFADIERIIGAGLPPSAFRHRPWWSNNPSNSVITNAWLEAGYRTENVDMAGKTLVFVKTAQYPPAPEASVGVLEDAAAAPAAAGAGFLSSAFGALKGTVTVQPGTDLTDPMDTTWDATR